MNASNSLPSNTQSSQNISPNLHVYSGRVPLCHERILLVLSIHDNGLKQGLGGHTHYLAICNGLLVLII